MENEQFVPGTLENEVPIPITYTEALPSNLDVIAIDQIDVAESSLFKDVLKALFDKKAFSYQFRPSSKITSQVQQLYFRGQFNQRNYHNARLGFGYPVLVGKDNKARNGIRAIPLFIWAVDIQPHTTDTALWSIKAVADTPRYINPALRGLSDPIDELIAKCAKTLKKTGITAYLCSEFCDQVAEALGYENNRPVFGVEAYPALRDLLASPVKGKIQWSAVISTYPKWIAPAYEEEHITKEYWDKKSIQKDAASIGFDYLINDHYQKEVAVACGKHSFVKVEGASGTGKTQVLVNFLIENLINGQSTLVVGPNQSGLNKVLNRLIQQGLISYAYDFRNPKQDKKRILELITPKLDVIQQLKNRPSTKEYEADYTTYQQLSQQLHQLTSHYGQNVFDIHNRAETIGLFLKNNKTDNKDLLSSYLSPGDFQFTMLELTLLSSKINKGKALFSEAFAYAHPLEDLSKETFLYQTKEEAKTILQEHLHSFISRARKIQHAALLVLGQYKDQVEDHFEKKERSLYLSIETFQEQLNKRTSEKSRPTEKAALLAAYQNLKKNYHQEEPFEFIFDAGPSSTNLDRLRLEFNSFKEAFGKWQKNYALGLSDSFKSLSSTNTYQGINFQDQLASIETSMSVLIKDINAVPIFSKSVEWKAMTLPLKIKQIEALLQKMMALNFNCRDFDTYYPWRQYWQELNPIEQKVLSALIAIRPENWEKAFKSWYFQYLLKQQVDPTTTINYDELKVKYYEKHDHLTNHLATYLRTNWLAQNWEVLQELTQNTNFSIPDFLQPIGEDVSFSDFYSHHFDLLQKIFPIQLMTSSTFDILLGGTTSLSWDKVAMLNTESLSKAEGASILGVAKQVVAFGTGKKSPTLTGTSFCEIAKKIAGKQILLKRQHQSSPIALLHFNNAAFQQYLELPPLTKKQDLALQVFSVNGLYHEATKTNPEEATYILALLHKIFQNTQGGIPKIGIVCATRQQANYIAAQFLDSQQMQSGSYKMLQAFKDTGMTICSFEDMLGQAVDTLIVSLTYGCIDIRNTLTKDLDYYNTPKGELVLQNLLTSATNNLYVCTSMPLKEEALYGTEIPGSGLFIYYNFLEYLRANHGNRPTKRLEVLKRLGNQQAMDQETTLVFNEEIVKHLRAYFGRERVLTNVPIGDQNFPIVIKGVKYNAPSHILLIDSFSKDADAFSFTWQRAIQKELENKNYRFFQVWSKDWWKNPEEEARQLALKIIRADEGR